MKKTLTVPAGGLVLWLTCLALLLSACASAPLERDPGDPLERYNRIMFTFNEGVDTTIVRPAAVGYEAITPQPVRTGVGNFFGNIGDVWNGFNNLLQGKVEEGLSDWMRFLVNSTFGLLGVLDVATEMGLPKHDEDFGQTLAVWGVGEGSFIVLPFFGPSTLRDTAALPADIYGSGYTHVAHVPTRNALTALRTVHLRSTLLGVDRAFEEAAAMDRYTFMRDFHLQQRRYKVHDGEPPLEYEDWNEWDDYDETSGVLFRTEQDRIARSTAARFELTRFDRAGHGPLGVVTR